MKHNRKFTSWIILPGLIFTLVMVLGLSVTCKNPEDDNPDGDTLLYSPVAPRLIAPADSYNFMTDASNLNYILKWEAVDSAQAYELVLNNNTLVLDSNSFLGYIDQNHFGETRWRVRATSTRWKTGYTEWSDTLVFFTSHPPNPPEQILPPYDAQIVSDSITAYVGFEWGAVVRAQFYELEIYYDSALIYSISMPQFTDSVYLDDTGRYEWRIRAGSSHWQMPGRWSDPWPFFITRP
jgi:hypothetical protein